MVRNNLFFLKNINIGFLNVDIFDNTKNNLIFLVNLKKLSYFKNKYIFIKKINFNKNCINILYF